MGTLCAFERLGELERGLAAELHDHAVQRAVRPLGVDDLDHVLGGERLEIEPVRGVVVGRHRLGIAVDHDGLVAGLAQREGGVAAAVVELDALADAVRPAAQDHDLLPGRRRRLVGRLAGERRLVGRVHVGGGRGELRRAGVDALEHRPHAERAARRRDLGFAAAGENRQPRVGEPHRLETAQRPRAPRQALRLDLAPRSPRCRGFRPGTMDRSGRRHGCPRPTGRAAWPAPPAAAGRASACRARREWRCGHRPGRAPRSPPRRARSARSPASAAPSAGSPGRCGRSPSPRRPTSSTWSAPARRREISRTRSAEPW